MDDFEQPVGPLQSAWAREVQRRHMAATMQRNSGRNNSHNNRPPPRQGVAAWRAYEAQLQPEQPRFADFSQYGYELRQVPAAVEEDLRQYFEQIDTAAATGARALPSVQTVTDAEFARLPLKPASELEHAEECAICCAEVAPDAKLKVLPCGHSFHAPCLRRWFQRSRCCPCCRAPLRRSGAAATRPLRPPQPPASASGGTGRTSGVGRAGRSATLASQQTARAHEASSSSAASAAPAAAEAGGPDSGGGRGDSSSSSSGGGSGGRSTGAPSSRSSSSVARAARAAARELLASSDAGTGGGGGGGAPSRVPGARTADGGVVVRHYASPPPGTRRPPQVPPDAELLIVRYPEGTARVWRAPNAA